MIRPFQVFLLSLLIVKGTIIFNGIGSEGSRKQRADCPYPQPCYRWELWEKCNMGSYYQANAYAIIDGCPTLTDTPKNPWYRAYRHFRYQFDLLQENGTDESGTGVVAVSKCTPKAADVGDPGAVAILRSPAMRAGECLPVRVMFSYRMSNVPVFSGESEQEYNLKVFVEDNGQKPDLFELIWGKESDYVDIIPNQWHYANATFSRGVNEQFFLNFFAYHNDGCQTNLRTIAVDNIVIEQAVATTPFDACLTDGTTSESTTAATSTESTATTASTTSEPTTITDPSMESTATMVGTTNEPTTPTDPSAESTATMAGTTSEQTTTSYPSTESTATMAGTTSEPPSISDPTTESTATMVGTTKEPTTATDPSTESTATMAGTTSEPTTTTDSSTESTATIASTRSEPTTTTDPSTEPTATMVGTTSEPTTITDPSMESTATMAGTTSEQTTNTDPSTVSTATMVGTTSEPPSTSGSTTESTATRVGTTKEPTTATDPSAESTATMAGTTSEPTTTIYPSTESAATMAATTSEPRTTTDPSTESTATMVGTTSEPPSISDPTTESTATMVGTTATDPSTESTGTMVGITSEPPSTTDPTTGSAATMIGTISERTTTSDPSTESTATMVGTTSESTIASGPLAASTTTATSTITSTIFVADSGSPLSFCDIDYSPCGYEWASLDKETARKLQCNFGTYQSPAPELQVYACPKWLRRVPWLAHQFDVANRPSDPRKSFAISRCSTAINPVSASATAILQSRPVYVDNCTTYNLTFDYMLSGPPKFGNGYFLDVRIGKPNETSLPADSEVVWGSPEDYRSTFNSTDEWISVSRVFDVQANDTFVIDFVAHHNDRCAITNRNTIAIDNIRTMKAQEAQCTTPYISTSTVSTTPFPPLCPPLTCPHLVTLPQSEFLKLTCNFGPTQQSTDLGIRYCRNWERRFSWLRHQFEIVPLAFRNMNAVSNCSVGNSAANAMPAKALLRTPAITVPECTHYQLSFRLKLSGQQVIDNHELSNYYLDVRIGSANESRIPDRIVWGQTSHYQNVTAGEWANITVSFDVAPNEAFMVNFVAHHNDRCTTKRQSIAIDDITTLKALEKCGA